MFLYGTSFGDKPTFAPSYTDTIAKEAGQRAAAAALWQTTKDLADYRDNSNAEDTAIGEAYERRNKAIFDATGVQLSNPRKDFSDKDLQEGARIGDAGGDPWKVMQKREADWQSQAAALARSKPEFAGIIAPDRPIAQDAYAITRGAEKAAAATETQAEAAGLGTGRKLVASLGGGIVGALRDPMQIAALGLGGGISSPARSFGWRLLESVFSEAAVNGGIEAGVQVASHDYKQQAGVDASLSTGLKQVGLAALFGGGFGGLLEGGRTVARLLGRDVPEEVLSRAANGNPEPGDFTTIAEALGVTPDPATVRAADLAAEQPALDAAAFGPPPEGLDEAQATAMAAQALRAADSPDDVRASAIDRIVSQQSPVGPAPKRPVSLMQFLSGRSVGGIKDESGELAAMGLSRKFVPGGGALVRKGGKRLDEAREAAAEAGYFDDLYGDPQTAVAKSTPDDLLRLLRQEAGGEPVFSARNDGGRQFAWLDYERQRAAQTAYRRLVEEVDNAASSLGIEHRLDDSVLVRAAELVDDETSPVDALERALDEDYRNYADALAERGEEAPDVQDIPFFEDTRAGPETGRAVGEARADGAAGGPGRTEAPGGGLSRVGGDEGESGLRGPGETPEPATPEAGELAALALTEARRPSEKTAAGEQTLIEGVKPVSTKEKLDAQGNKPLRGGDAAPPEGGLFDLEARKQLSIWDAMPAAKGADGTILHATHETMIADADRTEFFGDLIASCKD
ncbi:hypothetical protein EFV37_22175 [Mesorhizobium loti]|uniref:Uncharacterized protein n=1 Tax=Mesorhizobium jarvisii TaxID=1777867 RepID=A0A6M7TJ02_9HYPH|nr:MULTISPECIES: hypothetical protein [Mesorhizobium]OBQ59571.1 hypothetical protein A9K72_25500 [Mesorhizobium loti]QKC64692.1 hypothetical protein EB229_22170 [Mesorhizobium jarvisii]QKD10606.1 hypothetical protein EFV37_22175 [Mesorhizobium loti]RJT30596.1 hypothetical protein D3242_24805 [Mesorhizobium jarvisii]